MIDEIKLFRNMINYHPTIIGWLIKNNKVEKKGDKLVVYTPRKEEPSYIKKFGGEVYLTNSDGSKRISSDYYWNKNFTRIDLLPQEFVYSYEPRINKLVEEGFELYDIGNRSERHCLTSQLESILNKCYNIIGDIFFDENYPRLKGKSALCFIKWLESKHAYFAKDDFNSLRFSKWKYLGVSGFSDYQPEVIENIKKYGIFAYVPVYERIEWDFDLVEKYKDTIHWLSLLNKSNLIWDEEMLMKYDKYIPFVSDDCSTFSSKFWTGLSAYGKFGFLSNKYLDEHKDVLDWREVFEKCSFQWNAEELTYFCNYVMNIEIPFDSGWMNNSSTMSEQMPLYMSSLLHNKNFKWDKNNLEAFLNIHDSFWDDIAEYNELYKIFLSIPDVHSKAEGHISKKNFWETVEYNHDFPYDEMIKEFNIETIKQNVKEWSKPVERDKLLHTHRTPDTNYSYYLVITKWDKILNNRNLPLTYELCNYLKDLEVTVGGTYCQSDGGYMEEDHRWPVFNALRWCLSHHIENKDEIEKIIEDEELLKIFLDPDNSTNEDILKYMCDTFFEKTSLQQYLQIINSMKDWNKIKGLEE